MTTQIVKDKQKLKEQFIEAMNFRHATKEYDATRKISDDDFQYILQAAQLSPSSLGAEPWKFLVVQNQTLREKMMDVCPGAVEKLKTASHFMVILSRRDVRYDSEYLLDHMKNVQQFPEEMIGSISEQYKAFQESNSILDNERSLNAWSAKQTYIPLGNMLTAAAMIGIDSTPMEGFNAKELNALLEAEGLLENGAFEASALAAFGYRKADPQRPKSRRSLEELVTWA